jgi:hypothetical protein
MIILGSIYLYTAGIAVVLVVSYTKTKLYKVESKSTTTGRLTYRHTIFLEKAFVEDSLFPFKPGDNLIVKIDGDKLVITRAIN